MSSIDSIDKLRGTLGRIKSRLCCALSEKKAIGNERAVLQVEEEIGVLGLVEAVLPFTPFATALRKEQVVRCKSCNAGMVWIKMTSGRPSPVNAEETAFVVTQSGEVVKGTIVGILVLSDEGYAFGRTSHFATCPAAAKHRRKDGKETTD